MTNQIKFKNPECRRNDPELDLAPSALTPNAVIVPIFLSHMSERKPRLPENKFLKSTSVVDDVSSYSDSPSIEKIPQKHRRQI